MYSHHILLYLTGSWLCTSTHIQNVTGLNMLAVVPTLSYLDSGVKVHKRTNHNNESVEKGSSHQMDTNTNITHSGPGRELVYPNNKKSLYTDLRELRASLKPLTTNMYISYFYDAIFVMTSVLVIFNECFKYILKYTTIKQYKQWVMALQEDWAQCDQIPYACR